jgi:hypothetical protein
MDQKSFIGIKTLNQMKKENISGMTAEWGFCVANITI